MAYDINSGLLQIAIRYNGGTYSYSNFPIDLVQADSYDSTPAQVQDLESHITGWGYLKRKTLKHDRSKIEMNTSILSYAEKCSIVSILTAGFACGDGQCNTKERKLRLRYYHDWTDGYAEGFFYVPDITFPHKLQLNGTPLYQPIRIAFIEY